MHSLAIAPDGDVFIADTLNNRVRKYDPKSGVITNLAGTGEKGFGGDGAAADKAAFSGIYCIALDPRGERLYLADLENRRIRMVDLKTHVVTTVAGNGEKGVPQRRRRRDRRLRSSIHAPSPSMRKATSTSSNAIGHALRVVDPQGRFAPSPAPG